MANTPQPRNSSYGQSRRLSAAKAKEFNLVENFNHGYRNREEPTKLPPGVLVAGSQNVLTNTSGRVGITKGYTLDGSSSVVIAPILSSFDWKTAKGYERHLRAGFLTSAGNDGKLQFRYVNSAGTVIWTDLMTGLTSTSFNFVDFWDYNTEKIALLLFVNGAAQITEWSGATTTYASSTTNTITKQGTTTWAQEGFYANGTRQVTINGTVYTYTGGEGTTTLTGVTPDPTGAGIAVGDLVFQTVRTTTNGSMTGLPLLTNDIIGVLNNQVYVGSFTNNDVYVSKTNNYKDYSFSATRAPSQGAILNLGETPIAFAPQEEEMYIGTKNQWYLTKFTLSADLSAESLTVGPLKTASRQGPKSQALTSKDKNNVVFISNEPVLSAIGRVQNIYQTPQITDLSFPIVNDMNDYNFTDGSVAYWKNYILVAVPKSSLIRIYNQTNPSGAYWEAPVTYPISRFSIIEGDLYGHSYLTSESYHLFTGYNFNGSAIDARAIFSYNHYNARFASKSMDELYIEGRITQNGTLNFGVTYDTDGCATETSYTLDGNSAFVCTYNDVNALGKNPLGKKPLGGDNLVSTLPPLFRMIQTFTRSAFYLEQTSFSSLAKDFQWELICFGSNASLTSEGNNEITN